MPLIAVNNYFKTLSAIINMAEPICFVGSLRKMIILSIKIDQTWTLQGIIQNVSRGKLQETK